MAPSGQGFSAQGGLGSFSVTTTAACAWSAVASANWITILQGTSAGTGQVNYAVAANSGGPRSGTISVGGQVYTVDQQGFTCAYSIGPAVAAFPDTGGNFRVTVTAPAGCPWTALSNVAWIIVTSGASGTGSGSVVLQAAPNAGGPRSGTATIAGQTFSATQGAGACGAFDVTSKVRVSASGLSYIYPSSYFWSQTITVANTSGSVISGPVYLVLLGLPTHLGYPRDAGLLGSQLITTYFSPQGDYLLLLSGDVQPGQTIGIPLVFFTQSLFPPRYSTKVLSGQPSH